MNMPTYLSGAIFAKAHKALRTAVVQSLQTYNLSPTAWSFLGAVASSPDGIRLVEMAKRLGVKPPLITSMANGLIERGLIKRVQHQLDARAKLLVITPEGKKTVWEVEQEVERELHVLLKGLTEADLNTYKKVLETIITNAHL